MIEEFDGDKPLIHASAWVHDAAVVLGEVTLEENVTIWPCAVLRGDMNPIVIGKDSNIQDGAVVHTTTGLSTTRIGERVTVGHNAILHGCTVGDDCLIGMGSIILDNAVIGSGSIVGAGTLVTARTEIPPNSLVLGSPGRVVRTVNEAGRKQIVFGYKSYLSKGKIWRNKQR